MNNHAFQFRQFTVRQDRCAMKVGTDGTLLGAWAHGGRRVLDIGTGTGLIALMMAQRFPEARVMGIEIDEAAADQARANVEASPFHDRVAVVCADITSWQSAVHVHESFDAIVCNPPYFSDALECPDRQRSMARHTTMLNYASLMDAVRRLLSSDGELSVIVPFDCRSRLEAEAALAGLVKQREWRVMTTPHKAPRRFLLAFGRHAPSVFDSGEAVLEELPGVRSAWYRQLTQDFYLK